MVGERKKERKKDDCRKKERKNDYFRKKERKKERKKDDDC